MIGRYKRGCITAYHKEAPAPKGRGEGFIVVERNKSRNAVRHLLFDRPLTGTHDLPALRGKTAKQYSGASYGLLCHNPYR